MLALVFGLAACGGPSDDGDPPSDDVLISYFNQHWDDIKALAQFIREKGYVGTVAMNHMDADHALRQDPVNLEKIRAMMGKLGIARAGLSADYECVTLQKDGRGTGSMFHYKGYRQCHAIAGGDARIVEDTDLYIKMIEVDDVAEGVRHIEDDWYVYHLVFS